MIDPGTGLAILGSAIGGSKIAEKILGPTSEYIGEQIKIWTEKKIINTANIFKNAEKKLGNKINEEGKVPPKVLKSILEEGAWCEENLQVEYFGGVLASSRTGTSRDDRGAYFVSLVSRLSTYQLRAHFWLYKILKSKFDGKAINIHNGNTWKDLDLFLPYESFTSAMDFTPEEEINWLNLLSHVLWGLHKEELLNHFEWGPEEEIKKRFPNANADGIIIRPTKLGTELIMWASGLGQHDPNEFFSTEVILPDDQDIIFGDSYVINEIK